MGGSSGGGNSNTKSQTLPPPQLSGSYWGYGNQLQNFINNPGGTFAGYQGPTMAPVSPYTQGAVSALANPAAWNQASGYFGDVAAGNYLGLSPAMRSAVLDPVTMNVNNSYNALGRYGGGANAEAAIRAGTQALLPYYQAERGAQAQAAQLLPQLQAGAAGAQQQAGSLQQAIGQQAIQEQMAQFAQQHYNPQYAALQAYGGLLSPGSQYNITTGQTSAAGGSPLGGALGGGLAGAAAGSYIFPGPGTLIGGLLGATGGYFGYR